MIRINRNGKDLIRRTAGILAFSLLSLFLASCSLPASSPATATVTTTATTTVASTATVTATLPAGATVPLPTTTVTATVTTTVTAAPAPSPSASPGGPDLAAQLQKNNNGHFLIGREISGYNRILQPDGSYVEIPQYRFVYYDFDLLNFTTNQGAVFVPRIPGFTDYDDWFVKFSTLSFLYPTPFKVNWAFVTKSGAVSSKTSLRFYQQSYFEANYYKNPGQLSLNIQGPDLSVDSAGIHFAELSLYDNFVALVRTDNPGDILGWWIKVGSLH